MQRLFQNFNFGTALAYTGTRAFTGARIMKCGICKAEMAEEAVTYTEDIDEGVVVVRRVPAQVCPECGNIWYTGTVAARLEKIIDALSSQVGAEVSIVNFVKSVA
jgi:YgiT-type zinc finger domain-containing protein